MNPATFRLVLMISSAHAFVHVFESALPSVEQLIGDEFHISKDTSGWLGTAWRIPFGGCALAAGWLTDRFGARRTLVAYLFGCAAMTTCAAFTYQLDWLFVAMFAVGMFASIYHPAGLALISHATPRAFLPRALGIHGILGSVGIAGGPFLAAIVLSFGVGWRGYFLFLAIPASVLGGFFLLRLDDGVSGRRAGTTPFPEPDDDQRFLAFEYFVALSIAALSGFIYAGIIHFMPRYLDGAQLTGWNIPNEAMRNYLTAGVLLLGVIGQYTSGRFARPHTLERWLVAILFLVVPCLLAMAVATGVGKIIAAGTFSICYFMSQPVYNSLIPKYVPSRRRSLGFGLNFMVTFGIGSLGAAFSGYAPNAWWNFGTLAACSALAGCLAIILWIRHAKVERILGKSGEAGGKE